MMSDEDPKLFGRKLAETIVTRMVTTGMSAGEAAATFPQEIADKARDMLQCGLGNHQVAEWVEAAAAAYEARLRMTQGLNE